MTIYEDFLGTEIKVGDVVAYVSSTYATLYTGMVTKRNPVKVQINGSGGAYPSQCLVVTERYKTAYSKKYQELVDKYSPEFSEDAKKPNPMMRYEVHLKEDLYKGAVTVIVVAITDKVRDPSFDDGWEKHRSHRIARNVKYHWKRDTATDTLCISSGDYARSLVGSMPAKYIRQLFGGVPPKSEVFMKFDNIVTCGEYFKDKGVLGKWKT